MIAAESQKMPDEPVTIVFLVHGTFARGAEWVNDNSLLRKAIQSAVREAGSRAIFKPLRWTGRNSSADRWAAARDLDVEFRQACIDSPGAPIFLVGHSHGGSVISYFWRNLQSELRKRVSGAAFLSTPFIATRIRPDWRELAAALAFAMSILVFLAIMVLVEYVDATSLRWSYEFGGRWYITVLALVIFLIGLLAADLIRRAAPRWGRTLESKMKASIDVRETARFSGGNNIFLRTTGDEAAVALALGQFAIWGIGLLNLAASRVVIRLDKVWRALWRSYIGRAVAVLMIVLYGCWITGVVAIILDDPWSMRQVILSSQDIPTGMAQVDRFLERAVYYLSPVFFLLSVGVLGFAILLLSGVPLCLLALWVAGWTGVKDGLFTEIAIEPIPLGITPLHHLDWNVSEHAPSLRHSYTYSNPDALKCLSDWMLQTLRRS